MSLGPLVFSAAAGQFAALLASRRAPRLWLMFTLASAALGLAAAGLVLFAGVDWEWRGGPAVGGSALHVRLDGLSAFFVALLALIEASAAIYAREYWADAAHPRSAAAGRTWWTVLGGGLALVLTVSNGLHFLLGWEVFAVAAFFLVTLNRQAPPVRAAGALYLNASHVATLSLFAFFALLAARTGSWELGPMRERTELAPLVWLALFGFGLKAGAFPLHVWLPSAHASAPTHVSALLSGVTIKVAVYGLMRFTGWLPLPSGAGWVVVAAGLASAVLGVAFALGQHDLKRLLAYHSVENIGIILIGFGFALVAPGADGDKSAWGKLALAGALLHVWNHGLFKSLLFLGAGSVLHATGTREMSRLGGLWRTMPWTAALFAVGAVAICGLPPLNGFISEWLVYLGLFGGALARGPLAWAAIPAIVILAATGALALACFTKVCGVVFLGAPRSSAAQRGHEGGWQMRGAMLGLAVGCAAIGLFPALVWPALSAAGGSWRGPASAPSAPPSLTWLGGAQIALLLAGTAAAFLGWRAIQRRRSSGLTWDCGYAAPSARMQYTAGSFAATLTDWFAWILRPIRHASVIDRLFPANASHASHTPETVLDYAVTPAAKAILRSAVFVRRLQHGRLSSYLLYLVLGIAGLAWLVMTGGPQ